MLGSGHISHTWQAVAAGGMSIGHKGMMVAAKTLAFTAMDIYKNPAMVDKAKKEVNLNVEQILNINHY